MSHLTTIKSKHAGANSNRRELSRHACSVLNARMLEGVESGEMEGQATLLPLSPAKLDEEGLSIYESEFSFAFGDNDIRNIALSGPYGAGKNTVMESWERMHGSDHKFLHVQLAHFKSEGNCEREQDLEAEIINQLIHKTDPKLTPKSKFRRTRDSDLRSSVLLACALLAFAALSSYLGWGLNAFSFSEFLALPIGWIVFAVVCGILWVVEAVAGITWLIRTSFLSRTLKKLKFLAPNWK